MTHHMCWIWQRLHSLWLGEALSRAVARNRAAAEALDAVVKEMLEQ
ncbi:hypothetical protein [Celeribacter halophilus]|uniref:Uncharacterized protein n=1 Tax=Celeribacter halophilus TaxID=576117 RepID=A0A1I3NXG7_9RHOB|nr:hypothetical protein [Celeribacter halophilus]PZX14676.1 hypothetical protein LX82_00466 [Celeribacter halophilus]SFJ13867.1 hypothetical protein SAMN04488138_102115 [Celeribacter halophilus]